MSEKLPDDIMDFDELRGYLWAWISRTITHKEEFKGEHGQQLIKFLTSVDYYLNWFIERVNELEEENETRRKN